MTRRTVRLHISGRVQGVGFRAWAAEEARALALQGWVRNEKDGTVTALVSGDASTIEEMIAILHRGPPGARVDGIEAAEQGDEPGLSGFKIRR